MLIHQSNVVTIEEMIEILFHLLQHDLSYLVTMENAQTLLLTTNRQMLWSAPNAPLAKMAMNPFRAIPRMIVSKNQMINAVLLTTTTFLLPPSRPRYTMKILYPSLGTRSLSASMPRMIRLDCYTRHLFVKLCGDQRSIARNLLSMINR